MVLNASTVLRRATSYLTPTPQAVELAPPTRQTGCGAPRARESLSGFWGLGVPFPQTCAFAHTASGGNNATLATRHPHSRDPGARHRVVACNRRDPTRHSQPLSPYNQASGRSMHNSRAGVYYVPTRWIGLYLEPWAYCHSPHDRRPL